MTARVATNTAYRNSVYYMNMKNLKVDHTNQQYNTGKKFQTASEAPADFAQTMRLENDIAMYEQFNVNSGYALDSLSLEESSLSTINSQLDRADVLLQSAVNGRNSGTDYNAIANELREIQKSIADLANTKTATGESIFSGSKSDIDAYIMDESGHYTYQGDAGQRMVQASASVKIAVSDSGLSIFEKVATGRTINTDLTFTYDDYSTFETFYNKKYIHNTDAAQETAANTYSLEKDGDSYVIKDFLGGEVARASGGSTEIGFNGLVFKNLDKSTLPADITLSPPKNENVFNTLNEAISAIEKFNNGEIGSSDLSNVLSQVQISVNNTQVSVNSAMGAVGARGNALDNVIASNGEISDVKQEAKATISEVDLYEVTTDLAKNQSYLQMAMTAFNYVTGTTLFDYIH